MNELEKCIREMIFRSLPKPTPKGTIKCDATLGSIGLTGSYRISDDTEATADFLDVLPQDFANPENDFTSQVERLHQASCGDHDAPRWYRCNIDIEGNNCSFRYWREDPEVSDLSELEPTIHGSMPTFPFRHRFSLDLLKQLNLRDFEPAFLEFVPGAIRDGKQMPSITFGYFALLDWQADTNNGSLDQYFARHTDWLDGNVPRESLYPEVLATLNLLGLNAAARLFEEAIALYSHFHQHVDRSRNAMAIPAIPKQTESDIMTRYYDMIDDIETRQWSYFAENLAEFAEG